MVTTIKEADADGGRKVRVLTWVLQYDDLLADAAASFSFDESSMPLRLGRAPDGSAARLRDGALLVPDRWASTGHCHLRRVGTSDVIQDDGSRNGTFVNGERVERYRVLVDGDLVEVGHTLLCYRVVDAHAAAALTGASGVSAGPTRTCNAEVATIARDLRTLAGSREPVLIVGEPGVGKETFATAVHAWSGRAGPLRVIDCAAVTDATRDAMFVGREEGGGAIEHADGGTVLLDDVGQLHASAQATLLRLIEDGRVSLVGSAPSRELDVRWIATTADDLFNGRGTFRADLLRSLAGYVARLPPLRRRREDLGTLCAWLLRAAGFTRASITPAAGRQLFLSAFAGNIRQLRTVLRAAATLAGDGPIDVRHLPPLDMPVEEAPAPRPELSAPSKGRAPTVQEIVNALEQTGGNVVRAAECLGTHPRQVYRWIERHEIPLDRFRR